MSKKKFNWDYVNTVMKPKQKNMMRGQDEQAEKEYNAYRVNRELSKHQDCIMWANEMNRYSHLDKLLQYEFFINTIRKQKRKFVERQKEEKNDSVDLIMEFFGYGRSEAKQALTVLTPSQVDQIRLLLGKR
jgi:hypothetical protein